MHRRHSDDNEPRRLPPKLPRPSIVRQWRGGRHHQPAPLVEIGDRLLAKSTQAVPGIDRGVTRP